MEYRVIFDSLTNLSDSVSRQCANWLDELQTVQEAVRKISTSENMSGHGADNIKEYFEYVHGNAISALKTIIRAHENNVRAYLNDYRTSIDTDAHAIIASEELRHIMDEMDAFRYQTELVADSVTAELNKISDILYIRLNNTDHVYGCQNEVKRYCDNLNKNICALEDRHYAGDFNEIRESMSWMSVFIGEQTAQTRNYKPDFSSITLPGIEALEELNQHCIVLESAIPQSNDIPLSVVGNEHDHVSNIDDSYVAFMREQDRINAQKFTNAGICLVAGITTLVIAGIVAARSEAGSMSLGRGSVQAGGASMRQGTTSKDKNRNRLRENGEEAAEKDTEGLEGLAAAVGVSSVSEAGLPVEGISAALTESPSMLARLGPDAVVGCISDISPAIDASVLPVTVIDDGENPEAGMSIKDFTDEAKETAESIFNTGNPMPEYADGAADFGAYGKSGLKLGEVNGRKSLMRNIDYDYVDEKTGMTNRELMEQGRAPYDSETGEKIQLQPAGKNYGDSPLVELLGNTESVSGDAVWKNDKTFRDAFNKEKANYWKARSAWGMA